MTKSRVAVVRCTEYNEELVYNAVKRGIDLLGGMSQFARSGEKIVIKPNVLRGNDPAKCVTTHPLVFKAVGKLLQTAGARVSYGDSPSFGSSESNLEKAQLKQVGDAMGFALADFDQGREVSHKTAMLNKKFVFANGVLDADGLVSLPKLKTHGLTRFTGAVKNQFGCIPGILKGQFHVKMGDPYRFAAMLVDINTFIRPRLYVMDGITAMEGNGPASGKPRQVNALLFSADPIAMDAVACKMINLNPEFVPTSRPGETAGLGTYHYENIEVVGDNLDSFVVKDFQAVRKPPVSNVNNNSLLKFMRNRLTPRPVINTSVCTGCGTCASLCPVGQTALDGMGSHGGKKPKINYNNCIRCYCCQEVCPEGAITISSPFLGKLIFRQ